MSRIGRRPFTLEEEEASLLLDCGSFWPDLMVDKSSFMQMLVHVLNVETQLDIQAECWEEDEEEELTASGACNASGVVDVKRFVAACQQGCIEGAGKVLGVLSRPQQQDERLAAPSGPSIEMLDAANTKPRSPSDPSRGDARRISSTMPMASAVLDPSCHESCGVDARLMHSKMSSTESGEQTPLPTRDVQPKDLAGAVLVVDSKQYVLGERLGDGAGGFVFAATLKRETADVHAAG
eukprot:3472015-Amphidinium_carterae.1